MKILSAERAGFEPAIRFRRIHTFQACSFNHSDTSPDASFLRSGCKYLFYQAIFKLVRDFLCL